MPTHVIDDGDVGGRAKRQGYRAAVNFPVSAKVPNKDGRIIPVRAEALDLSIGGMLVAMPASTKKASRSRFRSRCRSAPSTWAVKKKKSWSKHRSASGESKSSFRCGRSIRSRARRKIVKKTGSARNGVPTLGIGFADLSGFSKKRSRGSSTRTSFHNCAKPPRLKARCAARRSSSPVPAAVSGLRLRCAPRATAPILRSSQRRRSRIRSCRGRFSRRPTRSSVPAGRRLPLACDIRFEDQVSDAVGKTVERFGGIDACINNASAISLTLTSSIPT